MWWIVMSVGAPVLVLSVLAATWPVMSQSLLYRRWQHQRARHHPGRRPVPTRAECPMCGARFDAPTPDAAVHTKNEHVVGAHSRTREGAEEAATTLTGRP